MKHQLTTAQAMVLFDLTSDKLEELMRGDWVEVRQDVADLHELLAVLARLQS